MSLIIFHITVFVLLATLFSKQIHRYRYIIYSIAAVLILILIDSEVNVLTLGYTGISFFIIVMYTGVLEKGYITKKLRQVRAEYAVLGTLSILPHALIYLEYILDDIGILNISLSPIFGLIAMVIIVPLFITSFHFVRRKMTYVQWKRLHQLSYLFYGLLGLHLILIQNNRQIYYIVIFLGYLILRLWAMVSKYNKHRVLKEN
ncbi:MAG: ferric reductase-like transmembrane domain-containing protein [Candidatus Izemoplasma sp.]|nr:ferric reductase-like transmembrane domain-containing protein [Candidatus Izemoplasma sp.]